VADWVQALATALIVWGLFKIDEAITEFIAELKRRKRDSHEP